MNKKFINDLLTKIESQERALKEIAEMEVGLYFYKDRFYQMKEIAENILKGEG